MIISMTNGVHIRVMSDFYVYQIGIISGLYLILSVPNGLPYQGLCDYNQCQIRTGSVWCEEMVMEIEPRLYHS